MADVVSTVTEVRMTVAEVGLTVTKVGCTVTERVLVIRVLLIPKVELARSNEELTTRVLDLVETVTVVLDTAVEFCNTSLDPTILLVLIAVVNFSDFKDGVTKLEFNKGVVVTRLISVVDITVLFPVNIAVVRSEIDFRTGLVSVEINLLVLITLLSEDEIGPETVTLVFETATKLLVLDSKLVEERKTDLLLGRTKVLVTLLLKLGTTDEEFTTIVVNETVRVEIITWVVFDGILV